MGFLHDTAAVARREVGRLLRQPVYLALPLFLPLLAVLFFAVLFGGGVARDIPIAVLDEDRTTLSRKAAEMIDQTPTAAVAYDIRSMEEGERLMREGRISAIVRIPASFEKELMSNGRTHVENWVSGTNITVNGLLSKDIQTAVTTFTAGVQLQLLTKRGLSERQAMAQLMPIRFVKHVLFNPYVNYGYYLMPVFMPMMLLVFVVMATVYAIGSELRYASARDWIAMAGGRPAAALAGKLLPTTAVMTLLALAMQLILFRGADVPLNGSFWLLFAATLLFIAAYQAIAATIVILLANLRLALSIGGGYSVLAFTFSGLTFPIMAMWAPMRVMSRFFPFTFYTEILVDQTLRGAPVGCSLPDMGWMALFLVLPLLVLPRLKRICTEERFWRKL